MTDPIEEPTKIRWTRSQRFQVSDTGREAGSSYRELIVASRSEGGRQSFDAARGAWATRFSLDPNDGLYLGELKDAALTLDELNEALEGCGTKRADVKVAMERLVKAQLIELVAPPPPPPPKTILRRW